MHLPDTLSEGAYEMLREAVNTVREHQCPTIARLKERLAERWPGREGDIGEAIRFWSTNIRSRYPDGVPRH